MSITNTLYNLIPDYFKTDKIDNVIERENGAIFYDEDLNTLNTWILNNKVIIGQNEEPFQLSGATIKSFDFTLIVELNNAGSYSVPEISTLTNNNFIMALKNVSGGDITINTSGSDTIEGETSLTLLDTEAVDLYISTTTEYKIK